VVHYFVITSKEHAMVRLADLGPTDRENMLKKVPTLPKFDARPWVKGPALAKRRVAIVSTAGLHKRGDRPFGAGAMDYRVIPGGCSGGDLVMSHMSVTGCVNSRRKVWWGQWRIFITRSWARCRR
jgi:hypothetical protein